MLADRTRSYLRDRWDAVEFSVETIGEVIAIEIGEIVAEALPTSVADNYGRSEVRDAVETKVAGILEILAAERDRA